MYPAIVFTNINILKKDSPIKITTYNHRFKALLSNLNVDFSRGVSYIDNVVIIVGTIVFRNINIYKKDSRSLAIVFR